MSLPETPSETCSSRATVILGGGTFEISIYDMGTGNQHCTNVNVDDMTYEPGHFADK